MCRHSGPEVAKQTEPSMLGMHPSGHMDGKTLFMTGENMEIPLFFPVLYRASAWAEPPGYPDLHLCSSFSEKFDHCLPAAGHLHCCRPPFRFSSWFLSFQSAPQSSPSPRLAPTFPGDVRLVLPRDVTPGSGWARPPARFSTRASLVCWQGGSVWTLSELLP